METTIEENIFMARIAEQAERFQDMVDFLKIVIEQKGPEMSPDERSLISVAFKNLVASKRTAWRTLVSVQGNNKYVAYTASMSDYKTKLEDQLFEQCNSIIALIQVNILKKKCADEVKAFFTKLVADNQRYIAEMSVGDRHYKAIDDARQSYEQANLVPLQACSPIKLSISLNLSVFYYEIIKDMPKACQIADQALNLALEKIDDLGEEEFKDAKAIIELLKENLNAWKEDDEASKKPLLELD